MIHIAEDEHHMTCTLSATIDGACVVGPMVELCCYLIPTKFPIMHGCDAYLKVGGGLWMLG